MTLKVSKEDARTNALLGQAANGARKWEIKARGRREEGEEEAGGEARGFARIPSREINDECSRKSRHGRKDRDSIPCETN